MILRHSISGVLHFFFAENMRDIDIIDNVIAYKLSLTFS
jgi:hypothetical protein